ncbi:MAG TPA: hypothetical protein PLB68_03530 [Candidatus Aminicenantes bacterium]|nr:hypothetical protein [Candidatus Aminicenantes bacterium]
MKKTLLTLFILLTFLVSLQAAEKKVTRLGGHPFYKSKNLTPDELKKIAVDRAGDVKMGFEEAGYGGLVYPFLEQLQKAELKETTIEPGDKLMWMLAKRGKKVTVGHDIVWAGKKPVSAYTFKIARDENIYEFVIPKICANISLKSIAKAPVCALAVSPEKVEVGKPVKVDTCGSQEYVKNVVVITDAAGTEVKTLELPAEGCSTEVTFDKPGVYTFKSVSHNGEGFCSSKACEGTVTVWENKPPVCKLEVRPTEVLKGQKVTIDGSGSTDPDGKIINAAFEVKDANGVVEESKNITEPPFSYELKTKKVGEHTVSLFVKDDGPEGGKTSEGCTATFLVKKRGFILADAGFSQMYDPNNFVFLRLGYSYKIQENLRINGLVGPYIEVSDEDYGTPVVLDVTLTYHPSKFWIGGGTGLWLVDGDSKLDLIANVGYEIFSGKKVTGSLFLEGRSAFKDFDKFKDMARYGLGLRLSF